MGMTLPLIFTFVFVFVSEIECVKQSATLVGTHIIYRHGDRAPAVVYPTSTSDPFFWPNGLGQLTPRGQLQHIRLGQYLGERYSELLNSTYVASEVKLNEEDKWPEALPWQPIPVHTVARSIDYLMGISDCPRFSELLGELANSERVKNLTRQYQDFFNQLEIWAGTKINDFSDALAIADTVLTEVDLYNITPSWANSSVLAQLRQILDLSYYELFDSAEMNRIHVANFSGPMIRDIMENIENLMTNKPSGRKAKIYSGHDAIIVGLLSFFGTHTDQPPYCSTLFFDLYHMPDNTYALKLEYLNSTNGRTTQPIPLPPCSSPLCPIEMLSKWLENKLPSNDMNKECMPQRSNGSLSIRHASYHLSLFFLVMNMLAYMYSSEIDK
ncbi:unnamed protein product [Rotaria sordida]|uniref:acid phosphatase n=1 Tax=Rotaria sordida TaxID=392033 RepID=A0A814BXJ9_9BILA|nr:unnamed protein product [Rotaria sordida]